MRFVCATGFQNRSHQFPVLSAATVYPRDRAGCSRISHASASIPSFRSAFSAVTVCLLSLFPPGYWCPFFFCCRVAGSHNQILRPRLTIAFNWSFFGWVSSFFLFPSLSLSLHHDGLDFATICPFLAFGFFISCFFVGPYHASRRCSLVKRSASLCGRICSSSA